MLTQYICVYDFETDDVDPNTCNPVQLAACMLHPISLDIVPDSMFCIDMQPPGIQDNAEYVEIHKKTIAWHADNYKVSSEEIIKKWEAAPKQKVAWEMFVSYLANYNKNQARKTKYSAPIRAGMNIRNFDNTIINRLCKAYGNVDKTGEQNIFHPRDTIDILEMGFYWFHNLPEPEALNMLSLRKFFGIPTDGAHDARKDVEDEAWMVSKFMRLFRHLSPKVPFKDAYTRAE